MGRKLFHLRGLLLFSLLALVLFGLSSYSSTNSDLILAAPDGDEAPTYSEPVAQPLENTEPAGESDLDPSGESAGPVERFSRGSLEDPSEVFMVPLHREVEAALSLPQIAASRSLDTAEFSDPLIDSILLDRDASKGLDGLNQDATLELFTGLSTACVRLEDLLPPTMDCTIPVGQTFEESLRAGISGATPGAGPEVEISLFNPSANMTLARLDESGNIVEGPVTGSGQVNARLSFSPAPEQVTTDDLPIMLEVRASTASGDSTIDVSVVLRFHVVGQQSRNIVGYLFSDANGNGQRDYLEEPLRDWPVQLAGASTGAATSDSHGRFVFRDLAAGQFQVSVPGQSGWVFTGPASADLSLDGSATGHPNFVFRERAGRLNSARSVVISKPIAAVL